MGHNSNMKNILYVCKMLYKYGNNILTETDE